ncbi:oligopeptide/dipeptide ABC transporter ATP-binding protein [Methanosarcina sp. Mfa9]|uniref:oligopeptide/dipeptide ABC transporter ATP-binding protein n=1 Tax=Methanosarcina sp. Mfa9 TaxID=3439063 RepID=UPI003F829EF7
MFKKHCTRAVDNVSFQIRDGQILGLVGESGSGKTTVGKCILRFAEATSGSVVFDGVNLLALDKKTFLKLRPRIQMIFQDPFASLDPRMRIGESIGEALKIQGFGSAEISREVSVLLPKVGLGPEHVNRYPHQLSGGQNQRVALARALAMKPQLIIADEMTASLDVSVQAQILSLILALKKEFSLSMLFISHDLGVVRHMCDRVAVMYSGQILEMGAVDEVFARPLHPYTRELLADKIQERDGMGLKSSGRVVGNASAEISGKLPQCPIFELESGVVPDFERCVFYTECPHASLECRDGRPKMIQIGADHFVRCIRSLRAGGKVEK